MSVSLVSGLIFLLAGLVQGMTGFGAGLVAIPLLCLIMDLKIAVSLCILNGIIITTMMAYELRHLLDYRKFLPLLIGSIPGIFLGTLLLKEADPILIKQLLGFLLVSYSGCNLVIKLRTTHPHVIWGYIAGFFSGAITATVSAGGPPVIIYTMLTDWKRDEIKATLTGFFVLNGYLTAAVHAANGIITQSTLSYAALTLPFVLTGTFLGARIGSRMNRRTYLKLVYLLLIGLGVLMMTQ